MIKLIVNFIIGFVLFQILRGILKGLLDSQQDQKTNGRQSQPSKTQDQSRVIDLCPDCGDVLSRGHRCPKN